MAGKKVEAATRIVRKGKSAAEKKLESLQAANKRQRSKAKESQDTMKQAGIAIAMAFALGYAARMGWLARIPRLGGMPVLATTGIVGVVGGMYVEGTLGDVLTGVGMASLLAAAYQMGSSSDGSVSGEPERIPANTTAQEVTKAINQLKAELGDGARDISGEFNFHGAPRPVVRV